MVQGGSTALCQVDVVALYCGKYAHLAVPMSEKVVCDLHLSRVPKCQEVLGPTLTAQGIVTEIN